ncbi:hypothetical protein KSS87_009492, partial [Heliosperma pusillum]
QTLDSHKCRLQPLQLSPQENVAFLPYSKPGNNITIPNTTLRNQIPLLRHRILILFLHIKSIVKMVDPETAEASSQVTASKDAGVEITCFTEVFDEATVHFQIMRLNKQIYVWIGCDSAKMGSLYAAAPTRPHNEVSVASLLAGTSDNTGAGIARRLDELYWNASSNGKFSIKSALAILKGEDAPTEGNSTAWHVIWKLPVQQRIRMLVWLAAHDRLMTNYNRVKRVLRTGLNIVLACNLPKNNSMLEISAEKKLAEKLISLGYTKPRSVNQHELQKV